MLFVTQIQHTHTHAKDHYDDDDAAALKYSRQSFENEKSLASFNRSCYFLPTYLQCSKLKNSLIMAQDLGPIPWNIHCNGDQHGSLIAAKFWGVSTHWVYNVFSSHTLFYIVPNAASFCSFSSFLQYND